MPGVAGRRRAGDRRGQRRRDPRRPRPDGAVPADEHGPRERHRVASYAFITVPALGVFPPMPRPKAPELRVASGEQLRHPARRAGPGGTRAARRASPTRSAVHARSDGPPTLVVDDATLQFTSAAGYAGPASITVARDGRDRRRATPTARTRVITLPITVYAVDDYPPTFAPSRPRRRARGGAARVDLRAFTTGPEGASPTRRPVRLHADLGGRRPGSRSTSPTASLTLAADATTPKGTTGRSPCAIGYGRTGLVRRGGRPAGHREHAADGPRCSTARSTTASRAGSPRSTCSRARSTRSRTAR